MKKQHYTLIEMLVTVAVIAILAGIAAGAYSGIQKKAMLNRAAADCTAIQLAIKNFEAEYTTYPNFSSAGGGTVGSPYTGLSSSDYQSLIQTLTGVTWKNTTVYSDFGTNNRKKIKFLDLPSKYSTNGFVDPWGKEYKVVYNTTGNPSMTVRLTTSPSIYDVTLLTPVAVFTQEGPSSGLQNRFATSWGGVITR